MMLFSCNQVARETGVGIETVENWLRSAAGPKDVSLGDDKRPMFTMLGRKKFAHAAAFDAAQSGAADRAPLAVAGSNGHGEGQGPRRATLRLVRANLWSPRIALAEHANGNEVQVLVRSTAMLKTGMVLVDCIEEGMMGWSYLGRLPRTLGEQQLFFPPAEGSP